MTFFPLNVWGSRNHSFNNITSILLSFGMPVLEFLVVLEKHPKYSPEEMPELLFYHFGIPYKDLCQASGGTSKLTNV